jgi:hypothetical protein
VRGLRRGEVQAVYNYVRITKANRLLSEENCFGRQVLLNETHVASLRIRSLGGILRRAQVRVKSCFLYRMALGDRLEKARRHADRYSK